MKIKVIIALLSSAILHAAQPPETIIIGSSQGEAATFQIAKCQNGEAAWMQVQSTAPDGSVTLYQADEKLFRSPLSETIQLIPNKNLQELVGIYAAYLIQSAGGVAAYQAELDKCAQYHIPLPNGILLRKLTELGIRSGDTPLSSTAPAAPSKKPAAPAKPTSHSLEW